MKDFPAKLNFLTTSSEQTLQSFECARLDDVCYIRRTISELLAELAQAEIEAEIARFLMRFIRLEPARPQLSASV